MYNYDVAPIFKLGDLILFRLHSKSKPNVYQITDIYGDGDIKYAYYTLIGIDRYGKQITNIEWNVSEQHYRPIIDMINKEARSATKTDILLYGL